MSFSTPDNKAFCLVLLFLFVCLYSRAEKTGLIEIEKRPKGIIDSLFVLASSNISINNEIALLYAEKGKELLNQIDYKEGEKKYLLIKAQIAYYDDRYKDALALLDTLGKMLSPDINTPELGRYYSLKALVNIYLGYLELAIEMNMKAISVYEKLSDYASISNCYNSIGSTYLSLGNNEMAEHYFNLAYGINQRTSHKNVLGVILINMGSLKIAQDSLSEAMRLFSQAYNLFLELGDLRRIALSLYNIAEVQSKVGEYTEATVNLDESLKIYNKLDEKYGQAMVLCQKIIIYRTTGQCNLALEYGEEAYSLAVQINSQSLQTEILLQLSKTWKAIGNHSKALDLYETYHANKTEMESKNNARRISEIEYKAQLTANEKDIQLLHQRNRAKTMQINILIAFSGIVILFTFGFILFLRLKNKNLRQKQEIMEKRNHLIDLENKMFIKDKKMLESNLELKNRELTSRALALIQLNETLKNVSEKINEFQLDSLNGEKQIKAVLRDIQLATHNNIWEEFNLAFSHVHNRFYEKLLEICPNLSATEVKTAALIKLNLSTKEIAAISFKSESSVKTARHRLRQKLNIGENDNLVAFLLRL